MKSLWVSLILSLVTLSGCVAGALAPDAMRLQALPRAEVDEYTLLEGSLRSTSACSFDYRFFQPLYPRSPTLVVLGHGFLRDQDHMVELSRHLANAGVRTATLDFCNMRPWNGHHRLNAHDMRSLAMHLGAQDDVIYAGFSAGALAAVLAADSTTRAVVTLDLVDQDDMASTAMRTLAVPLAGLHGPPSSCNAYSNGLQVFEARYPQGEKADTLSRLIPDASHCEFESPSDWLCETLCGDEDSRQQDQATRETISQATLELIIRYLQEGHKPGTGALSALHRSSSTAGQLRVDQ